MKMDILKNMKIGVKLFLGFGALIAMSLQALRNCQSSRSN